MSLGGNLLLNFGPRGDGSLAPVEVALADEVGAWTAAHGAAVYDSGPADGWEYPGWGFYTAPFETGTPDRGSACVVHAIVVRIPVSGLLTIALPAGIALRSVRTLADGAELPFTRLDGHTVQLPAPAPTGMPSVLVLETVPAGPAGGQREPNPDVALV